MDTNRFCRIVARLCFLGAVAFAVFSGWYVTRHYMGLHNTCYAQMQSDAQPASRLYLYTDNHFYYCEDTVTGNRYSPLDDKQLLSEIEKDQRAHPDYHPDTHEAMRLVAMRENLEHRLKMGTLVGHWDIKALVSLFALCVMILVASRRVGFYSMKALLFSLKELTK
jgi:hypothetical protein